MFDGYKSSTPKSDTNLDSLLFGQLTDRQRTVLETAFHAGFVEWPLSTSEEMAANEAFHRQPSTNTFGEVNSSSSQECLLKLRNITENATSIF